MLKQLIQQVTQSLKIPTPEPNDKGEYQLTCNDGLTVTIFAKNKDAVVLLSPFGNDSLKDSPDLEKTLKKVLQWSLVRQKENPETVSWKPDNKQLFLFRELPAAEASEKTLKIALESFLNNLEFWNKAIEDAQSSSPSSPFPL